MRDPERIQEILDLIKEIWVREPDLRFNQLLYNIQRGYSHVNGGEGQVIEVVDDNYSRTGFDLFNLEDSSFVEYLRIVRSEQS